MTDITEFAESAVTLTPKIPEIPETVPALVDAEATFAVLEQILIERVSQDLRWGQQNHPNGTGPGFKELADSARSQTDEAAHNGTLTFRHILVEEVYEAFAEEDPALLRAELLQVAGVAAAWVEAIDRRAAA